MKYFTKITLKDGRECILRNGTSADAEGALNVFLLTHEQTDFLLTYTDESSREVSKEAEYLKEREESDKEIEIGAEVDGYIAGTAGITCAGDKYKTRHRADFGIGIDEKYWNLGIGKAMLEACIECAGKAGYEQIELNVVSDNEKAFEMYKKAGFTEYGRNPRGFKSRMSGYQELIYMRRELN